MRFVEREQSAGAGRGVRPWGSHEPAIFPSELAVRVIREGIRDGLISQPCSSFSDRPDLLDAIPVQRNAELHINSTVSRPGD
jgi:hypothetical protein